MVSSSDSNFFSFSLSSSSFSYICIVWRAPLISKVSSGDSCNKDASSLLVQRYFKILTSKMMSSSMLAKQARSSEGKQGNRSQGGRGYIKFFGEVWDGNRNFANERRVTHVQDVSTPLWYHLAEPYVSFAAAFYG